jgi:hypothetical protein
MSNIFPRRIVELIRDVTRNRNSKHINQLLQEGCIKFIAEQLKVDVLFTTVNLCLDTLGYILLIGKVIYIIDLFYH